MLNVDIDELVKQNVSSIEDRKRTKLTEFKQLAEKIASGNEIKKLIADRIKEKFSKSSPLENNVFCIEVNMDNPDFRFLFDDLTDLGVAGNAQEIVRNTFNVVGKEWSICATGADVEQTYSSERPTDLFIYFRISKNGR